MTKNPLNRLNPEQARRLAIETAGRVIYLWDRNHPHLRNPANAIDIAQAYLAGSVNAVDLKEIRKAAFEDVKLVTPDRANRAAQQAAMAAYATCHPNPHTAAKLALRRSLLAVRYARDAEVAWQQTRVITIAHTAPHNSYHHDGPDMILNPGPSICPPLPAPTPTTPPQA